ncbi:MAG: DNA alkylation repair protein [Prevotella sp.]|nr:DNA alkylation repair protein [Prevotella sp.]MDD7190586.1 DNA alkylation repair protein [Prevotella sp.]MDY5313905.1 DNA alkylation repair protein [Prevotella sp.]
MTKEEIESKIKELKRGFRLVMNGPASQSMREKGLDYRLNWGVPFIQLKQMAADLPHDYDFAIALWKEDIRECKILATLLMPHDKMPEEVAEIWMEQTHSQEMAEMQAFNLYQYVSYAPKLAYRWMALDDTVKEICAYDILGRLFMKGQEPNERGINEFIDQAVTALKSPSAGLRHAAMNALTRFADLGLVFERLAKAALKREGFDLL